MALFMRKFVHAIFTVECIIVARSMKLCMDRSLVISILKNTLRYLLKLFLEYKTKI